MDILRNGRYDQYNLGYEYTRAPVHLEKIQKNIMKTRYQSITYSFFKTKKESTKKHQTIMPIHIILSDLSYI